MLYLWASGLMCGSYYTGARILSGSFKTTSWALPTPPRPTSNPLPARHSDDGGDEGEDDQLEGRIDPSHFYISSKRRITGSSEDSMSMANEWALLNSEDSSTYVHCLHLAPRSRPALGMHVDFFLFFA